MRYTVENEFLRVEVDSLGAELASVVDKASGAEMLWQGDPAVWPRRAPILFPYCGKLVNGSFTVEGKTYAGGQHGFARDLEHEFLGCDGTALRFRLASSAETLALFPFDFVLESTYALKGRTLRHTLAVTNPGSKELRFGIGYHPGFNLPFDAEHTTEDYELRFDAPQTPIVQEVEAGYITGGTHPMMESSQVIPMDDHMFDNDSTCMGGLTSKTLCLVEKDTGRRISFDIEGYPYTLIWSTPGNPKLHFLCVEPWHSLPDRADASGVWAEKPCAAALAPGEHWDTTLAITFQR